MKKIFFMCLLFCAGTNLYSETILDQYKLIENVDINYEKDLFELQNFFYDSKAKELYTIGMESEDAFLLNVSTGQKNYLKLPPKKYYQSIGGFVIWNNRLIAHCYEDLRCYELGEKQLVYKKKVALKQMPQKIRKFGKQLYLDACSFQSSNLCDDSQTEQVIINNEFKIVSTKYFKNPTGDAFSYFGNSSVTASIPDIYAVSDFDKYHIRFFNTFGILQTEINYMPKEWEAIGIELPDPNCDNQPIVICDVVVAATKTMSSIRSISYINETTLLVNWGVPSGQENKYIQRYDIWTYSNSEWKLSKENLTDFLPSQATVLDEKCQKIEHEFMIQGEYLIVSSVGNKDVYDKYIGKPYKEYSEALENYFIDNDLKTNIKVYKFK